MTRFASASLPRRLTAAAMSLSLLAPAVAAADSQHHHHHKDKDKKPPATQPAEAAPEAAPTPTPTPTPASPAPPSNGDPGAALPEKGKAPTDDELAKNKAMQERPWATGVSDADQQAALKAFAEGNSLIHDALFVKAAEKYREALGHWKHPAIYYNLALALVNLDKPVDMYDALEKAMAYGEAPLDEDKFNRAKGYKILVEGQLAHVELTCDQPGAKVFLDGQELFTAPGKFEGLVVTGEHQVIAKGEGFAPTQLSQKLGAHETMRLNLKLFTDEELTREKRVMPNWIPYAAGGFGLVMLGVGGLMQQQANSTMKTYDAEIALCSQSTTSHGCDMASSPQYADKKHSAETKQNVAIVGYAVGGAAVAAAIVLYIVNRPEQYRIDPFAEKAEPAVSVAPVIGPDSGGFAATVHF